jgi:hypothetical protein
MHCVVTDRRGRFRVLGVPAGRAAMLRPMHELNVHAGTGTMIDLVAPD